jgi:hypothetical protein
MNDYFLFLFIKLIGYECRLSKIEFKCYCEYENALFNKVLSFYYITLDMIVKFSSKCVIF